MAVGALGRPPEAPTGPPVVAPDAPGVAEGQAGSGRFLGFLLPFLSLGLRVLDAMRTERNTLERHLRNMGQLAFPFELEVRDGSSGPELWPIRSEHYPASKVFARISTL